MSHAHSSFKHILVRILVFQPVDQSMTSHRISILIINVQVFDSVENSLQDLERLNVFIVDVLRNDIELQDGPQLLTVLIIP